MLGMQITLHHFQDAGNAAKPIIIQKTLGTLRERQGTPIALGHCHDAGNAAQPIMPGTLKLSGEHYKQTPECHGCACSL